VWAGVMVRLFTSCLFFNQLRVCILKLFVILFFLQLKRIHKLVCNQPCKQTSLERMTADNFPHTSV
jgi:hypothetical protein